MAKQRITFITDEDSRLAPGMAVYLSGVGGQVHVEHVESVEDVPEPPIVQEFRVQVTSPSPLDPFPVSDMTASLCRWAHPWRAFLVTEVTP